MGNTNPTSYEIDKRFDDILWGKKYIPSEWYSGRVLYMISSGLTPRAQRKPSDASKNLKKINY